MEPKDILGRPLEVGDAIVVAHPNRVGMILIADIIGFTPQRVRWEGVDYNGVEQVKLSSFNNVMKVT